MRLFRVDLPPVIRSNCIRGFPLKSIPSMSLFHPENDRCLHGVCSPYGLSPSNLPQKTGHPVEDCVTGSPQKEHAEIRPS